MQKLFQSLFRRPAAPEQPVFQPLIASGVEPFDLARCWQKVRLEYFPDRPEIDRFNLRWSLRARTRMLACCDSKKRVVRVAALLNRPECHWLLPPLLYHEMCHAVLGPPPVRRGRRVIHGPEFKALERRHPGIAELDRWIKLGGWRDLVIEGEELRRERRRVARVAGVVGAAGAAGVIGAAGLFEAAGLNSAAGLMKKVRARAGGSKARASRKRKVRRRRVWIRRW